MRDVPKGNTRHSRKTSSGMHFNNCCPEPCWRGPWSYILHDSSKCRPLEFTLTGKVLGVELSELQVAIIFPKLFCQKFAMFYLGLKVAQRRISLGV